MVCRRRRRIESGYSRFEVKLGSTNNSFLRNQLDGLPTCLMNKVSGNRTTCTAGELNPRDTVLWKQSGAGETGTHNLMR